MLIANQVRKMFHRSNTYKIIVRIKMEKFKKILKVW